MHNAAFDGMGSNRPSAVQHVGTKPGRKCQHERPKPDSQHAIRMLRCGHSKETFAATVSTKGFECIAMAKLASETANLSQKPSSALNGIDQRIGSPPRTQPLSENQVEVLRSRYIVT